MNPGEVELRQGSPMKSSNQKGHEMQIEINVELTLGGSECMCNGEGVIRQLQEKVRTAVSNLIESAEFGNVESRIADQANEIARRLDAAAERMENLGQRLRRKAEQFEEIDSCF
jgi:hypothetical protein